MTSRSINYFQHKTQFLANRRPSKTSPKFLHPKLACVESFHAYIHRRGFVQTQQIGIVLLTHSRGDRWRCVIMSCARRLYSSCIAEDASRRSRQIRGMAMARLKGGLSVALTAMSTIVNASSLLTPMCAVVSFTYRQKNGGGKLKVPQMMPFLIVVSALLVVVVVVVVVSSTGRRKLSHIPAVYINLKRRPDRRAKCSKQLEAHFRHVHREDAVDGKLGIDDARIQQNATQHIVA